MLWGLDFSTLNRSIQHLTAKGILRREGYKIFVAQAPGDFFQLPPIHVICPHAKTFTGATEIAGLYGSRIVPIEWNSHAYRSEVRQLYQNGSEGLMIWTSNTNIPVADLLEKFQMPVVTLGNSFPGCSSVEIDSTLAGEMAVTHLAELKHTEVACFSARELPWNETFTHGYAKACDRLGLKTSATRIITSEIRDLVLGNALADLCRSDPQVTALVVADVGIGKCLLRAMKGKIALPDKMSVIVYGDADEAATTDPPLSIVAQDAYLMGKYAATLLYGHRLRFERTGQFPKPERLRLDPQVIARASTAPPHKPIQAAKKIATSPSVEPKPRLRWPSSLKKRRALVDKIWNSPHPRTTKISAERFAPVDIRPYANRSLSRYNSWLGYVPLHMPKTGPQKIHGVLFDIIRQKENQGHASIVMRSHHAHGPTLGSQVDIPLKAHADAIYFLHGCGWAVDHTPIGAYHLHYMDKTSASLPLIPYGFDPSDAALQEQWRNESNIQDWWFNFTQFNNSRARHLVVAEGGDPEIRELYLYTLEWLNPRPEKLISHLRITSHPDATATLGILAVTLVRPEPMPLDR